MERVNELKEKNEITKKIYTTVSSSGVAIIFVSIAHIINAFVANGFTNETDKCPGWSHYPVDEFLNTYFYMNLILVCFFGVFILSCIFLCCGDKLDIIPVIVGILFMVYTICYGVFIAIWRIFAVVNLVYTFNCHTFILPQYVSMVMIFLFGLPFTINFN